MNRDLIAELAGDAPPLPDAERDVVLLLRAAWLLSQHPDYVAGTQTGRAAPHLPRGAAQPSRPSALLAGRK